MASTLSPQAGTAESEVETQAGIPTAPGATPSPSDQSSPQAEPPVKASGGSSPVGQFDSDAPTAEDKPSSVPPSSMEEPQTAQPITLPQSPSAPAVPVFTPRQKGFIEEFKMRRDTDPISLEEEIERSVEILEEAKTGRYSDRTWAEHGADMKAGLDLARDRIVAYDEHCRTEGYTRFQALGIKRQQEQSLKEAHAVDFFAEITSHPDAYRKMLAKFDREQYNELINSDENLGYTLVAQLVVSRLDGIEADELKKDWLYYRQKFATENLEGRGAASDQEFYKELHRFFMVRKKYLEEMREDSNAVGAGIVLGKDLNDTHMGNPRFRAQRLTVIRTVNDHVPQEVADLARDFYVLLKSASGDTSMGSPSRPADSLIESYHQLSMPHRDAFVAALSWVASADGENVDTYFSQKWKKAIKDERFLVKPPNHWGRPTGAQLRRAEMAKKWQWLGHQFQDAPKRAVSFSNGMHLRLIENVTHDRGVYGALKPYGFLPSATLNEHINADSKIANAEAFLKRKMIDADLYSSATASLSFSKTKNIYRSPQGVWFGPAVTPGIKNGDGMLDAVAKPVAQLFVVGYGSGGGDDASLAYVITQMQDELHLTDQEAKIAFNDFRLREGIHDPLIALNLTSQKEIIPNPANSDWLDDSKATDLIKRSGGSTTSIERTLKRLPKLQQEIIGKRLIAYQSAAGLQEIINKMGNALLVLPPGISGLPQIMSPEKWAEKENINIGRLHEKETFLKYEAEVIKGNSEAYNTIMGVQLALGKGALRVYNTAVSLMGMAGWEAAAEFAAGNDELIRNATFEEIDLGLMGKALEEVPSLLVEIYLTRGVGYASRALNAPKTVQRMLTSATSIAYSGASAAANTYASSRANGDSHSESLDKSRRAGVNAAMFSFVSSGIDVGKARAGQSWVGIESFTLRDLAQSVGAPTIKELAKNPRLKKFVTVMMVENGLKVSADGVESLIETFLTANPDTNAADAWDNMIKSVVAGRTSDAASAGVSHLRSRADSANNTAPSNGSPIPTSVEVDAGHPPSASTGGDTVTFTPRDQIDIEIDLGEDSGKNSLPDGQQDHAPQPSHPPADAPNADIRPTDEMDSPASPHGQTEQNINGEFSSPASIDPIGGSQPIHHPDSSLPDRIPTPADSPVSESARAHRQEAGSPDAPQTAQLDAGTPSTTPEAHRPGDDPALQEATGPASAAAPSDPSAEAAIDLPQQETADTTSRVPEHFNPSRERNQYGRESFAQKIKRIESEPGLTPYAKNQRISAVHMDEAMVQLSPELKKNPNGQTDKRLRLEIPKAGLPPRTTRFEKAFAHAPHQLVFVLDANGYLQGKSRLGPNGADYNGTLPQGGYFITQHADGRGPNVHNLTTLFDHPGLTMRIVVPVKGKKKGAEVYQLKLKESLGKAESAALIESYIRDCESAGDTRQGRIEAMKMLVEASNGKLDFEHQIQ
jgi:hypothetical protein